MRAGESVVYVTEDDDGSWYEAASPPSALAAILLTDPAPVTGVADILVITKTTQRAEFVKAAVPRDTDLSRPHRPGYWRSEDDGSTDGSDFYTEG